MNTATTFTGSAIDWDPTSPGWLFGVERHHSPNHDARPVGMLPELVVIHHISLPPNEYGGPGIGALFMNQLDPTAHPYYAEIAGLRVSAHFVIRRHGQLAQYVSTEQRAWHAGVSEFLGRTRCNDFSLGIELEGSDNDPFTDAQYIQLIHLLRLLQQRYPSLQWIAGHADIAPGRKTDPGVYFEWDRVLQACDFTAPHHVQLPHSSSSQ
ncbi:1,6-anhydro-N-acetylmuramyl-L-alanine amidase AmpD [Parvibium lacunae]|uniref:1,6-anhydro-N-acetylmuramyl-L-alanine amidase AmpD n=1 Tax=Parvibium lacunae TaxID=1888893 RepID=A0A368L1L1_9BURK|nr:1,6-anhydro-N-acetylmuramyl-L-alanine amidase AmpD [Parvibium lacunae]RCS57449.1 1,6-anhydro-N-acetylmuramyl-L-alanine amidase AmpD [Parvibium lacunae]